MSRNRWQGSFWRYIYIDGMRVWRSKKIWICSVVVALLMLYSNGGEMDLITWACHADSSILGVMACLTACMPYATSFCDDLSYKFCDSMQIRGKRDAFILARAGSIFVSTFFCYFIGFALCAVILGMMKGIASEKHVNEILENNVAYFRILASHRYVVYILASGIHRSLLAGIMGLFCLFSSFFIPNKMAVYGLPAIVLYVQDIFVLRMLGWERGSAFSIRNQAMTMLEYMTVYQSEGMYYLQMLFIGIVLVLGIIFMYEKDRYI